MAETRLSPSDLARIDRDLDQLVMPSPETVRLLVAENRRLARDLGLMAERHLKFAGTVSGAGQLLHDALIRDAEEAMK